MKAVILAGGLGTRLSEETQLRPKPMVEIGGKPILWHIMKIYAAHGINDFVICLGYKGYVIKEYFANYCLHTGDVTFDLARGDTEIFESTAEPWTVTLVDTGEETLTGGRLKRVLPYLEGDETFCFTYGDGVADVDITALVDFHRAHGRPRHGDRRPAARPLRRARPRRRRHPRLREKPLGDGGWINGGFFVLEPGGARLHRGRPHRLGAGAAGAARPPTASSPPTGTTASGTRWTRCATSNLLESLWQGGDAPWKVWS